MLLSGYKGSRKTSQVTDLPSFDAVTLAREQFESPLKGFQGTSAEISG